MKRFDTRNELRELLPWYENGTLANDEHEAVRRLLATDLEANRQRRELHMLRSALADESVLASNMESNLLRLRTQILARPAIIKVPLSARWFAVGALATLLLCIATFFAGTRVGPYHTLTVPAAGDVVATDMDLIRVAAVAGVDAQTLIGIAADPAARVLRGPSGHGVATLAVPHAHARQVFARLQADERLRFVATVPR